MTAGRTAVLFCALIPAAGRTATPAEKPEDLAIAFLASEVPRWERENGCFSCHNNGDGARALYAAVRRGHSLAPDALTGTTKWLADPDRWLAPDVRPGDPKHARIQFAVALAAAYDAGVIHDRAILERAVSPLVALQNPDGAWHVIAEGTVGSPVTWGNALATYQVARALEIADRVRFAEPVARAKAWLAALWPENIPDAAAVLLSNPRSDRALRMLLSTQHSHGGWGPQALAPAEPFDTALTLLALAKSGGTRVQEAIRRGRAYLLAAQLSSGAWTETTRPAGGRSYAHQISTSAWATLALLATDPER